MANQSADQITAQRIAMKALIVDDEGRILLLREADTYEEGTNVGRYQVPGGRLDAGEPFLDGLAREVMEEAGLTVTVEKPLYVAEWFSVIKGIKTQIVAVFFLCRAVTAEVRLSEEHDDFQWVDPAKAATLSVLAPEDKVIEAYLNTLG